MFGFVKSLKLSTTQCLDDCNTKLGILLSVQEITIITEILYAKLYAK